MNDCQRDDRECRGEADEEKPTRTHAVRMRRPMRGELMLGTDVGRRRGGGSAHGGVSFGKRFTSRSAVVRRASMEPTA